MADEGIWATSYQPSIRSSEPERAAKGEEGQDANSQTDHLEAEPSDDPPVRMSSDWPEQHRSERSAEGK